MLDATCNLKLLGRRGLGPKGKVQPLDIRDKAVLALARIATARPGNIHRRTLAHLLWPDADAQKVLRNFQQVRSELRKLEVNGLEIVTEDQGLLSLSPMVSVDIDEVRQLSGASPEDHHAAAQQALAGFLIGVNPLARRAPKMLGESELAEWLAGMRRHMEAVGKTHLRSATVKYLARREVSAALETARELLAFGPEEEELHIEICETLLNTGFPDEADGFAKELSTLYAEMFDAAPSPELHELQRAIAHNRKRQQRNNLLFAPRVAILPLACLTEDPAEHCLAFAFPAELLHGLSDHPTLELISMSASRNAINEENPIGFLRQEFQADYVIEGDLTATPCGRRVRLRLLEAMTETIVWHATYELTEGRLDQINDIANALSIVLHRPTAETDTRCNTQPARFGLLQAYGAAREAYDRYDRSQLISRYLDLRSALARETGHASAWLLLAYYCECLEVVGQAPSGTDPSKDRADAIRRAHDLDPFDGRIAIEMGDLNFQHGRLDHADLYYEQAMRLSRGGAELESIKAKYLIGALSKPDDAKAALRRAKVAFPRNDPWFISNVVRTRTLLGDFAGVLDVIGSVPASPLHIACHAISAQAEGYIELAQEKKAQLLLETGVSSLHEIARSRHFLPYARSRIVRDTLLPLVHALDGQHD